MVTFDRGLSETWTLVLSAMGIDHQIVENINGFELFVPPDQAEKAQAELENYFQENHNWPSILPAKDDFSPSFYPPSLLLMGVLFLFFTVTGPWQNKSIWFVGGSGNTEAILERWEWWRLVTALSLHADLTHVLGNCFLGFILIHFFFKMTGNGLGAFSLLFSAVNGNFINVLIKGPGYSFVGFSTANFGLIGMLAMLSYFEKRKYRPIHFLMPIMAALAFLAMLGSSGERTDLGAHFFGLLCGLVCGRLLASQYLQKLRYSTLFQLLLFLLFLFIISISWHFALTNIG